jgi:hypothetical protein
MSSAIGLDVEQIGLLPRADIRPAKKRLPGFMTVGHCSFIFSILEGSAKLIWGYPDDTLALNTTK